MAKFFSAPVQMEFQLAAFVEKHAAHFGVSQVFRPEAIGEVQRTGFTWSRRPNTLCLATSRKYLSQALGNANISGLVTHSRFAGESEGYEGTLAICCDEPAELFYAVHNLGIHRHFDQLAVGGTAIAGSAQIAGSAIIHDAVTIEDQVIIHDAVTVLPGTVIRTGSEIHPGVILGASGFFSKRIFGKKKHIEHFGGVEIGSNCIIHAGSVVARSVNYQEHTRIETGVHMGIGVNIGHDCSVGADCDISSRVLLSGRVRVGRRCWIGAGAMVSNALVIGDDAEIKIGSVVIADVLPAGVVSGNFAISHKRHLREYLSS